MDNLTAAERRAIELRAQGFTNKQVATILKVSIPTVKNRIATAFKKLGAATIVGALLEAGWTVAPPSTWHSSQHPNRGQE